MKRSSSRRITEPCGVKSGRPLPTASENAKKSSSFPSFLWSCSLPESIFAEYITHSERFEVFDSKRGLAVSDRNFAFHEKTRAGHNNSRMFFEEFREDNRFDRTRHIFNGEEYHFFTAFCENGARKDNENRQNNRHPRLRPFFYFRERELYFLRKRFVGVKRVTAYVNTEKFFFPREFVEKRS